YPRSVGGVNQLREVEAHLVLSRGQRQGVRHLRRGRGIPALRLVQGVVNGVGDGLVSSVHVTHVEILIGLPGSALGIGEGPSARVDAVKRGLRRGRRGGEKERE